MKPVLLVVAAALLAGCGSSPAAEVRADVAAVTEAANDGDAARLRAQADALAQTVRLSRKELGAERADRLLALARSVRTNADVIDVELLERRRQEAEQRQLEQQRLAEEAAREAEAAREDDEDDGDDKKGKGKGESKDGEEDD